MVERMTHDLHARRDLHTLLPPSVQRPPPPLPPPLPHRRFLAAKLPAVQISRRAPPASAQEAIRRFNVVVNTWRVTGAAVSATLGHVTADCVCKDDMVGDANAKVFWESLKNKLLEP